MGIDPRPQVNPCTVLNYKRLAPQVNHSGDTMTQQFDITLQIAAENGKTENQIRKALINGLEDQETPELREAAAAIEVNEK